MRRLAVTLLVLTSIPLLAAAPREGADPGGLTGRAAARHMIVTLERTPTDAERLALAANGVRLQQPLAGGRYIARVSSADPGAVALVASATAMTRADKIHSSALRQFAAARGRSELNVLFHRDVTFDQARAMVLEAGGSLDDPLRTRFLPAQRLRVRMGAEEARRLADRDEVFAVAGALQLKVAPDNQTSAALAHVTDVQAAPYGLTGQGVVVSVFEIGEAQATHPEFGGRVTTHPPGFCSGTDSDCVGNKAHATHVVGTIASGGTVRASSKGMAPQATLHEFPVSDDWLDLKYDALRPLGVVADNNSWGYVLGWNGGGTTWWGYGEYHGAYELTTTSAIDFISNERGILFVHSAGNAAGKPSISGEWFEHQHKDAAQDETLAGSFCYSKDLTGNDCPSQCTGVEPESGAQRCEVSKHPEGPWGTLGMTAAAKNVIAVGNVTRTLDGGVVSPGVISSSSSRGPAKDGRVKPDVVALGTSVNSTIPTDSYQNLTGTSMASPAVTGVAALLAQQWRQTFGGADPTPAQLKALILFGATDIGLAGPDYTFGFGVVNAKASADAIIADGAAGRRIRNLSLSQGLQQELALLVTETSNLRVLANWNDPDIAYLGGDDVAAKALVNDLDLRVIDPSGQTHLPYVLDMAMVESAATRGVNSVDNVELVEIANAAPGLYRVILKGSSVAEGPQQAVVVASSTLGRQCMDVQEPNDSAAAAYGEISSGAVVSGGICSQSDADFFKFTAGAAGTVSVLVETGDTPVRATLSATGVNVTIDVPANTTKTLSANAASSPLAFTLKLEAAGTVGIAPQYVFVPTFGTADGRKQRGVRH